MLIRRTSNAYESTHSVMSHFTLINMKTTWLCSWTLRAATLVQFHTLFSTLIIFPNRKPDEIGRKPDDLEISSSYISHLWTYLKKKKKNISRRQVSSSRCLILGNELGDQLQLAHSRSNETQQAVAMLLSKVRMRFNSRSLIPNVESFY